MIVTCCHITILSVLEASTGLHVQCNVHDVDDDVHDDDDDVHDDVNMSSDIDCARSMQSATPAVLLPTRIGGRLAWRLKLDDLRFCSIWKLYAARGESMLLCAGGQT
eukprot:4342090-Amphidinium_carterae.1